MFINTTASINSTLPASIYTLEYTYVNGAYLCVAWMYPLHIMFAYLVGFTGIVALVSRAFDRIKFLHLWAGRIFVICMFCCMASSLLIYNTGLPTSIVVLFVLLTIGLAVGIITIKIHMIILEKRAMKRVQDKIVKIFKGEAKVEEGKDFLTNFNLEAEVGRAKGEISNAKGFIERFISFKAAHGLGMFVAWWNIFGRIIVTNPASFGGCQTYPAWKSTGTPVYVPEFRDDFVSNVWVFVTVAFVPAFLIFILIGAIWSFVADLLARYNKKKLEVKSPEPESKVVQNTTVETVVEGQIPN